MTEMPQMETYPHMDSRQKRLEVYMELLPFSVFPFLLTPNEPVEKATHKSSLSRC